MADLTIDRAQLEIVIKNDDSRRRIRELEEDSRSLTKEMKQLEKQGKKDTAEWHAKAAALKRNKYELDGLVNQIGLTGLSMKELKKRQGELNAIMNAMDPRTPEYKKLQVQLDAVNGRMRELKTKSQSAGTSLNNMANGFNKYFGMATAFAASITGIALGFRKLANDVAAMDDVYSDVMKTTGKTREEVIGLNEEFKKMDTRTSRESLNMLARDAGKLGINGTRDILDFVDAGNQINVALGEDLGDDAIKNIGKMVGVYKDASVELQNLGLKEQMLACWLRSKPTGCQLHGQRALPGCFCRTVGRYCQTGKHQHERHSWLWFCPGSGYAGSGDERHGIAKIHYENNGRSCQICQNCGNRSNKVFKPAEN